MLSYKMLMVYANCLAIYTYIPGVNGCLLKTGERIGVRSFLTSNRNPG
jgi:hypothetical protein